MARNTQKSKQEEIKQEEVEKITENEEELKAEEISNVETTPEENAENSDEVITEPEVVNSDGDVKTDEPAGPAPAMPELKKLICKVSFTDKFDKKTVYEVGKELNITDISRRNDLIERGLAVEE